MPNPIMPDNTPPCVPALGNTGEWGGNGSAPVTIQGASSLCATCPPVQGGAGGSNGGDGGSCNCTCTAGGGTTGTFGPGPISGGGNGGVTRGGGRQHYIPSGSSGILSAQPFAAGGNSAGGSDSAGGGGSCGCSNREFHIDYLGHPMVEPKQAPNSDDDVIDLDELDLANAIHFKADKQRIPLSAYISDDVRIVEDDAPSKAAEPSEDVTAEEDATILKSKP